MKKIYSLLILASVFFSYQAKAQIANSPYSILGTGKILGLGGIRNQAMGGAGVSMGSTQQANMLNPALLTYNKYYTQFEAAYYLERRNLSQEGLPSQHDIGGNISYFHFAMPLTKWWSMGFGLRPITSINYTINSIEPIANDNDAIVEYYNRQKLGEGGVNQIYFGHSFDLGKYITVGIEGDFVFGNIDKRFKSSLIGSTTANNTSKLERVNHRQFTYKPGVLFKIPLADEGKKRINIGGTYQPKMDYKFESSVVIIRSTTIDTPIDLDTLTFNDELKQTFPEVYTAGISYEHAGKLSVGVDYELKQLDDQEVFDNSNSVSFFQLSRAERISVGGEYTPDFMSATSYWKRITWRGGFKYETLDYKKPFNEQLEGRSLEDYSFNIGVSFPMIKSFSALSLAGEYGWTEDDLGEGIREEYFRVQLGLTINDRWFLKRRVN
ncbi:hypothetical protein [Algivirga pacifica]|uniref:Membrane protein n=1 Tax=Algivirga pacifica TaxID=1162670 RepID=A0ABP9DK65_9BACT